MPDELQQPFKAEDHAEPSAAAAAASPFTAAAVGDGGFGSQPLPAMEASSRLHAQFGAAPISPFADRAQQRRSSASSASRASRNSAGRGIVPAPQLTPEERALLEALDTNGLPAAAAVRSSGRLTAAGTLGRPAHERQSDSGQGPAPPPLSQLAPQYTLPVPGSRAEAEQLASAASVGASPGRQVGSAAASGHSSHAELAHASSLEHALHLAAEAAMGGSSQLAPTDGAAPGSSSGAGSSAREHGGGTPSSAGPGSRASTSRQASMAQWDSQMLHIEAGLARAGSAALSALSRHSSGHLPGERLCTE